MTVVAPLVRKGRGLMASPAVGAPKSARCWAGGGRLSLIRDFWDDLTVGLAARPECGYRRHSDVPAKGQRSSRKVGFGTGVMRITSF